MAKDYIGYETLADNALRMVVREALKSALSRGLVAGHHFYITFKTHDPGVEIPDFLKERYADEMTIVLQNQFWGLRVEDDLFEVTLTFQKMPATLIIPYAALTSFVDPGVQFGLQFRNSSAKGQAEGGPASIVAAQDAQPAPPPPPKSKAPAEVAEDSDDAGGHVVSLDKFRKK